MVLYEVLTEKFGMFIVSADCIDDARVRAKCYGVVAKDGVRPVRSYTSCDRCDSKPCVCASTRAPSAHGD